VIEPAQAGDLPQIRELLQRLNLPLDGVDDCVGQDALVDVAPGAASMSRARPGEPLGRMLVARDGAAIVGTAALELYADGALLRSVAVDQKQQGRQLGHALTEAALHLARIHGVDTVFLLTTTAERFFPRFGFEPIAREAVPASVRRSIEFQSACPASATVMRKQLA
jgi:amino-acid N-acetyltransferase